MNEGATAVKRVPLFVGAHVSASKGVEKVFERAAQVGASALQFFARSQLTWRAPAAISDTQQLAFAAACERSGFEMRQVVVHANYLLNAATLESRVAGLTRTTLRDELQRCNALRVPTLVMHPGSNADVAIGRKTVAETVSAALVEVGGDVRVALELMAGSGAQRGSIDDLVAIHGMLPRGMADRVGVCLDTCHAFAAGYNLRNAAVASDLLRRIAENAGGLLAVHANDSEGDLGSHIDRHANIGFGRLGTIGLWNVMNDARVAAVCVPVVLETPASDRISTRDEIELLRSLVGAPVPKAKKKTTPKRAEEEREENDNPKKKSRK